MARSKKIPPPEKETIAPGIERFTIGKGITRRSKIKAAFGIASWGDIKKHLPGIEGVGGKHLSETAECEPFEKQAKEARKILEDAGLPTDSLGHFAVPGRRAGGLLELVVSRDYRERESPEWYAADILSTISSLRMAIKHNWSTIAYHAYNLGNLVTEAKGLGYFKETGATGGKRKRRIPPVAELIRTLIRKNRHGTAPDLWAMIPTDQVDGLRIKGYKFYRNGGRLLALGKMDGYKDFRPVGKSLNFRSFSKRVGKERTPLAR